MGLTTGDWVSIGVSIIALLGVMYSTHRTIKSNNSNSKDRLDSEKKMKYFEIDQNIMASARIEWVQSVRNEAKEFIIMCYKTIELFNKTKEIPETSEQMKRIMYNLILYFGPDSVTSKEDDIIFDKKKKRIDFKNQSKEKLLDHNRENNDELNNWIVSFIQSMSENINDYITNNGYDEDIDQENLVIHSIYAENIAIIIQESGNDIDIYPEKIKEYEKNFNISSLVPYEYSEDVNPSELELEQVLLDVQNIEIRKEEAIREKKEALDQRILDFVQVMRIYIKVEWKNISKKRI